MVYIQILCQLFKSACSSRSNMSSSSESSSAVSASCSISRSVVPATTDGFSCFCGASSAVVVVHISLGYPADELDAPAESPSFYFTSSGCSC